VSEGSDTVSVMFRAKGNELIRGGQVMAKHGCWTLLKGGITANFSSTVEILFEVKHTFHKFLTNKNILKPLHSLFCSSFSIFLYNYKSLFFFIITLSQNTLSSNNYLDLKKLFFCFEEKV